MPHPCQVSVSLQSGLEFLTDTNEASSEATAINTQGSAETVFILHNQVASEQPFAFRGSNSTGFFDVWPD
jgi:hypothetical protein